LSETITVETSDKEIRLVTLRSPVPARYYKMFNSLRKNFNASLVTGTLAHTLHLRLNLGTFLSYVNLFKKNIFNSNPTLIDVNALSSLVNLEKGLVVDFRTPLSYELKWLGHNFLSLLAEASEKRLKDIRLVFAANEHMARYCTELGAKEVKVIPNYPTMNFKSTVESKEWKLKNSVSPTDSIVLFTGGVRVKEIYGAKLLLESWKLVENSIDFGTLVVLGDDSIDYIANLARLLKIKRILLPGRLNVASVANWINCSSVCVAPRTPGFSNLFYNHKDSTKISEYAVFKKPIVATCYAPSEQYLLVNPDPISFSEGIMKGLEGKINPSISHFWEENEPILLRSLNRFWVE
jgi:hypothetical protein